MDAELASIDALHLRSLLLAKLPDIVQLGTRLCLERAKTQKEGEAANVAVCLSECCSCQHAADGKQHQVSVHLHSLPARRFSGGDMPGPDVNIAVLKRLPLVLDVYTTSSDQHSQSTQPPRESIATDRTKVQTVAAPSKPCVAEVSVEQDAKTIDEKIIAPSTLDTRTCPHGAPRVSVLLGLPWAILYGLQYGGAPAQQPWTLRDFDVALFGRWWQTRRDKEQSLWAEKLALWLLRRDLVQQLSRPAKRTEANVTARDQQVCEGCYRLQPPGYVSAPFKLCSGCRTFVFCSVECHERAWPVHAQICRYIRTSFSRQETQCIKQLFTALHGEHAALLAMVRRCAADFRQRRTRSGPEHVYRLQMRFRSLRCLESAVLETQQDDGGGRSTPLGTLFELKWRLVSKAFIRRDISAEHLPAQDINLHICLCYPLLDDARPRSSKGVAVPSVATRIWPLTIALSKPVE